MEKISIIIVVTNRVIKISTTTTIKIRLGRIEKKDFLCIPMNYEHKKFAQTALSVVIYVIGHEIIFPMVKSRTTFQ